MRTLLPVVIGMILLDVAYLVRADPPATQPGLSSKPAVKDGLSVTVTLPKAAFAADESLKFTVQFKNVSDATFSLLDAAYFFNWTIRFEDVKSGGPWRQQMGFKAKRPSVPETALKPGEALDAPVELGGINVPFNLVWEGIQDREIAPIDHLKPGRYRLLIEITLVGGPVGDRTAHPHWTGTITTNPVEFEISDKPATQPAAAEAWKAVLTALQAGDPQALAKATTEKGYRSIMGEDGKALTPKDMQSRGQAWGAWTLRFYRATDEAAHAYMGPQVKESGLDFIKTADGWKLDQWMPGE